MKIRYSRRLLGLCLGLLAIACNVPTASAAKAEDFPRAKVALVGGTFINDALLKSEGILKGSFTIKTKAGASPTIWYGETGGVPFYYVHMHGDGKYVETWAALYQLGVRDAIGGATAGGINPAMKLYDYVVPHDFIDMNITRPLAMPQEVYKDPKSIPIPRYVPAMDPLLQNILIEETRSRLAGARVERADDVRAAGTCLSGFSDEMRDGERDLKRFMYTNLYHHPRQLAAADAARVVVAGLFAAYAADPATLPPEWRNRMPEAEPDRSRHIADFIAGMTDRYAITRYREAVGPVDLPEGF